MSVLIKIFFYHTSTESTSSFSVSGRPCTSHQGHDEKSYTCFLNLWLSKALNRCQKSIVKFRHRLCLYIVYIKKKSPAEKVCQCVCRSVCVLSIFCRTITRKRLHWSLWNFLCIFVYVSRTLLILAIICRKLSFFNLYCRFCLI